MSSGPVTQQVRSSAEKSHPHVGEGIFSLTHVLPDGNNFPISQIWKDGNGVSFGNILLSSRFAYNI